jgi:hypothetical protein
MVEHKGALERLEAAHGKHRAWRGLVHARPHFDPVETHVNLSGIDRLSNCNSGG